MISVQIKVQATLRLTDKTFDFEPLYSGGCLYIDGFEMPIILDISGVKNLPEIAEARLYHEEGTLVGMIKPEIVEVEGVPQIYAHGRFESTSEAVWVIGNSKSGKIRWDCSISTETFSRGEDVDYYARGEEVTVNKKTFVGPVGVVRRWSFLEGSFVERGGDMQNHVTIQARLFQERIKMNKKLRQFILDCKYDPDMLTKEQLVIFEKSFAVAQEKMKAAGAAAEEEPPADLSPEKDETQAQCEGDETDPETPPKDETQAQCEGDETETETNPESAYCTEKEKAAARLKAQRVRAARSKMKNVVRNTAAGRVTASVGAPSMMDVYAVALMRNLGLFTEAQVKASGFSDNAMTEGLAKRYNSFTFRELACEMIRHATGNVYRGTEDRFMEILFHPKTAAVRASVFSTQNPLAILSNVLNKSYYQGITRVGSDLEKIIHRVKVDNFHESKVVSYDVYGSPDDTAPDGALARATIVGTDYTIEKLKRRGNVLVLDRDMMINNEIEGFAEIPLKLGMKHQRKRIKRGTEKLLSTVGTSTFTTANGNYITNALTLSNLDTAAAALANMEAAGSDPNDKEVTELEGKYLIVPQKLAATADSLYEATNIVAQTAGGNVALSNRRNRFEVLVLTYMGTGLSTNGSDTSWFLHADPAEAAVLAEARLRGAEEARIQSVPLPMDYIGAAWQTYFEYAFGLMDPRAAVYSTGAST